MTRRRATAWIIGALLGWLPGWRAAVARTVPRGSLLAAPLELGGDWGGSPQDAAFKVIARVREVSLGGVRLLSDAQPERLRVDDHAREAPHIQLHTDNPTTAWIIVDIGARDWPRLAYQFGHELGHVLCNSWQPSAKPMEPTQWLEEAMADAFSLRGLGLLADSWERDPPFDKGTDFPDVLRRYRQFLIDRYRKGGGPAAGADLGAWFRGARSAVEHNVGGRIATGPALLMILGELERSKACVEDLGAVNRWPGRTAIPLEEYLRRWRASCGEIRAPGELPERIRAQLQIA